MKRKINESFGKKDIELQQLDLEDDEKPRNLEIKNKKTFSSDKNEQPTYDAIGGYPSPTKNSIYMVDAPDRQVDGDGNSFIELGVPDPNDDFRNEIYMDLELEENTVNVMKEIEKNHLVPQVFPDIIYISDAVKFEYLEIKGTLQSIDFWLCIGSFFAIALSVVDNVNVVTMYNIFTNSYDIKSENNMYRLIVLGINAISILLIVIRYYKLLRGHKLRTGSIADHDDMFNTGLVGWMWLEIFLNGIFIPPYLNNHFTMKGSIKVVYDYTINFFNPSYLSNPMNQTVVSTLSTNPNKTDQVTVLLYYNLSAIILFFMSFRIYHVFRLINSHSFYTKPKAQSICGMMNTQANTTFALKAYLKINPYGSLAIVMVFIIVIFGISMQILEYYNAQIMSALIEDNNAYVQVMQKFSNYFNSLWVVVVTMTTIGYGDIYPTTYFGRAVATLTCIFGTIILSLLVVFTNNSINLDNIERHVYIKVMDGKSDPNYMRREASKLIGTVLRYNYLRKIHEDDGNTLLRLFLWIEMKYDSKRFKIRRITSKRHERNIDELLGEFSYQLDYELKPFKDKLIEYNREKNKKQLGLNEILKVSLTTSESMLKNSIQMYNLLKILNKGKTLNGLDNIEEVYDTQVDVLDEIEYYHKNRHHLNSNKPDLRKNTNVVEASEHNPENSIIVNDQIDGQGVLEQYINAENSKDAQERELKSTIFLKKDEKKKV